MTRALESARNSAILQSNPKLTAQIGGYSYEISTGAIHLHCYRRQRYPSVPIDGPSDKARPARPTSSSATGRWYESRVSYFSALHGLDLTMGAQNITPHNLLEAAGRLAGPADMRAMLRLPCHQCRQIAASRPVRI